MYKHIINRPTRKQQREYWADQLAMQKHMKANPRKPRLRYSPPRKVKGGKIQPMINPYGNKYLPLKVRIEMWERNDENWSLW